MLVCHFEMLQNAYFKFSFQKRKFPISSFYPPKAIAWRERRIMTYCAWGCVQRYDIWPRRRSE